MVGWVIGLMSVPEVLSFLFYLISPSWVGLLVLNVLLQRLYVSEMCRGWCTMNGWRVSRTKSDNSSQWCGVFERQWTACVCMCVCVGIKGTYCYSQSEGGLDGTRRVHMHRHTLVWTWFSALTWSASSGSNTRDQQSGDGLQCYCNYCLMSRLEIDETLLSNSRDVYQYTRYQKFNCWTNGGSVDSETIIGVQAGNQALLTLM